MQGSGCSKDFANNLMRQPNNPVGEPSEGMVDVEIAGKLTTIAADELRKYISQDMAGAQTSQMIKESLREKLTRAVIGHPEATSVLVEKLMGGAIGTNSCRGLEALRKSAQDGEQTGLFSFSCTDDLVVKIGLLHTSEEAIDEIDKEEEESAIFYAPVNLLTAEHFARIDARLKHKADQAKAHQLLFSRMSMRISDEMKKKGVYDLGGLKNENGTVEFSF